MNLFSDDKNLKEFDDLTKRMANLAPRLDHTAKKRIAHEIGFKPRLASTRFRYAGIGAFAAVIIITIIAQSALPGSPLYAWKRGSEEVRKVVQPGFDDDDIKERREDEKRKLDERHKDDDHEDDDNSGHGSNNSGKQSDTEKEAEDAAEDRQKELEDQQKDAEDAAEDARKEAEEATKRRNSNSGHDSNDEPDDDTSGHGSDD